jgi:tRNA threonylcarbamoyl adenosine modification protein (Sua5/YciO/YrdC/YwlC family)
MQTPDRVFDCADPVARQLGIEAARDAAARGELVVMPTDTVYGVGADAFSAPAVQALLDAKGRGRDMPVPVLVGSWRTVDGLVTAVPKVATTLIEAFWPGGLSLVLKAAPSLAWDLGDTGGTVMVRMPSHPVALDVLRLVGPMAVSSANRSGHPPATTAQDALEQLTTSVSVYLDGGPAPIGVASTVLDLTAAVPKVLRVGAVAVEDLRAVVGDVELPG